MGGGREERKRSKVEKFFEPVEGQHHLGQYPTQVPTGKSKLSQRPREIECEKKKEKKKKGYIIRDTKVLEDFLDINTLDRDWWCHQTRSVPLYPSNSCSMSWKK